ncbi:hypothetical protein [Streptomyces griseocarneus]|uniref:hypothetical protein n=1 Tax=Streptomyces griseocarneus TaxID=51201 RepID=UPI00167E51D9|nr:hypothetical protein [Streptomyces griseocarneus]MBZ6474366.1 hypothetical protein [Streptomyces griseocarneus]GHG53572.1 hypothetical protein GCM10018779_15650 [Streptomyces griseocarneus]
MSPSLTAAPGTPARHRPAGPPGEPAVSRPVRWAAHAAALTLVPSGLWRCAVAFGMPSGFAEGTPLHESNFPGPTSLNLIGLSVFAECLGLLTLGLVQSWGERLPRWVPWLGGRRIPTLAAVVPALLGAAVVTAITVAAACGGWQRQMDLPESPKGALATLMTVCYAPLLAWGPLLALVTVAYYRRRRGTRAR